MTDKNKIIGLKLGVFLLTILLTACSNIEKQPKDITTVSQTRESESKRDNIKEDKSEEDEIKEETEGVEQEETEISQELEVQVAISDFSRQQESQTSSSVPVVEQAAASQDDKIQHIRDIYNYTVKNQENYQQFEGYYYTAAGVLAKAVVSNGNTVLDEVMHKNGYSTYSLEYYYEDWPGGDSYPIFIYAVIDKKEYRYYFCQGEFIRRVGPEGGGNTNDAPKMNSFIATLRDEGMRFREG